MQIRSAKDLQVDQRAFELAMQVFEFSQRFSVEERWALTGQLRRSSRSVCNNLREAWAKRRYRSHFISKLSDCDGENAETDTSLDFAVRCGYISPSKHEQLTRESSQVGRMLGSMIINPDKFLLRNNQ